MHFFYRIFENELSIAVYSTNSPGMLATNLLRLIFPELFNADNLRVYYSYFGEGKLKKRSLDQQCKSYLKRYLVTFYSNVTTSEEAYNTRVVSKINECLRRKVQPKM